jgi:hypothetical protein
VAIPCLGPGELRESVERERLRVHLVGSFLGHGLNLIPPAAFVVR